MINIKICGITRLEDALEAQKSGAWALGFIFFNGSKRYIEPLKAAEIISKLGSNIEKIGVFVDESCEDTLEIIKIAGLSAVQLHGSESREHVERLNEHTKVLKSFRVKNDFDCSVLEGYKAYAFLLDTYSDNGCYGGTGKTFDWHHALSCKKYGRIILAGGLNENNITEAIRTVGPWGLDVSSGVETAPGIKNKEKINAFFNMVKKENDESV
jgi:phosphoribosylanthranilate isomerase